MLSFRPRVFKQYQIKFKISFLKQLPPNPGREFRNFSPILESFPTAFASLTFAPVDSPIAETELLN